MFFRYYLGVILSLPLLPWMYLASKKVRRKVPVLEEPQDTNGQVGSGAKFNLVVLGESTMAGVGVTSHKEGFAGKFAEYLANALDKEVCYEVVARSGYTATLVANRLIGKIETASPKLIIIGLGANDAFTLNSPPKWRKNIITLINKLKEQHPGVPIVFINMPPIKNFPALPYILRQTVGNLIELLGNELNKIALDIDQVYYNNEIIRFSTWGKRYNLTKDPTFYFSDGIHPAAVTYNLWALDMVRYVQEEVFNSVTTS